MWSSRHVTLATLLLAPLLAPAQPPVPDPTTASIDKLANHLTGLRRREVAGIRTQSQAIARQSEVRATMRRLIGPLPERTPLNPVVLGETLLPGLRIQKILFDSQPGFHVTALLYLPQQTLADRALPAILMTPGHAASGKESDFVYAAAFARNGFAVLSYDPLGQGERLQYPGPANANSSLAGPPTGEHGEASLQPILLGESIAKYFLWDAMRALDYLETRPEIDPSRLGAFGCSGGGAVTALLGALDPRLKAIGTACYLTSWDALLATIGPQDAEQSTPGWLAGTLKAPLRSGPDNSAGLDFPDYVEAAAPTPYAIIATTDDMFPFAGAQRTAAEARVFYDAFNPPTATTSPLVFITGPGRHGNLLPILPRILKFFIDALQPATFAPIYDDQSATVQPPPGTFQVTSTGQVSTFDPRAETVFSLNLAHARTLPAAHPASLAQLQQSIRQVAGLPPARPHQRLSAAYQTQPGQPFESQGVSSVTADAQPDTATARRWLVALRRPDGTLLHALLTVPLAAQSQPLKLVLLLHASVAERDAAGPTIESLLASGHAVLSLIPQPSSPGLADTKSPLLGPWYLPALRSMLVGRTILGQRVADTLLAADYLDGLRLPHQPGLEAQASGHLALVLLHAAVLDERLEHVALADLPRTYAEQLADPLPRGIAQDILPGVILYYDLSDLLRALEPRPAALGIQPTSSAHPLTPQ